jgi:hypothetical protein
LDEARWLRLISRAVDAARSVGLEPGDDVASRIAPAY